MNQDTRFQPDQNNIDPTRIVRVARLFGQSPVSVLVHTEDGRREKIRLPDWEHVNPDTGGLTEAGWKFIETELTRIFGEIEWSLFGTQSR